MPGTPTETSPGANLLERLTHAAAPWAAHWPGLPAPGEPITYGVYGRVLYHHASTVRRLAAHGGRETSATAAEVAARVHRDQPVFDAALGAHDRS
jgi:hypothetical protein